MHIVKRGARRRASAKGWKHWAMTPLLTMLAGGSVLASLTTGPAAGAAVAAAAPPAPGVNLSAAAASASGVYLAYTGTDRQVYVLNAAAPGQARIALGGQLTSGPALAVVPAGVLSTGQVLAVFGRGTDNALWWRHQTTAGSASWTGWQSLGGTVTSKPAVVINGSIQFGALNVVAAGTTGRIWYRVYSSGWHAWTALGGPQVRPGTGPGGGFAITGTNDNIYLFGRTGTENGYADFGGLSTNSPGTAPVPAGLVVFARGTDNALWARPSMLPIGPTGPWRSFGGNLTTGVTATTVSGGKTYVFGLGTDNNIWMRNGVWPSLSGWQRL